MITAAIWSERWLPNPVAAGKLGLTRLPSGRDDLDAAHDPVVVGQLGLGDQKNAIITDKIVTASGAFT